MNFICGLFFASIHFFFVTFGSEKLVSVCLFVYIFRVNSAAIGHTSLYVHAQYKQAEPI